MAGETLTIFLTHCLLLFPQATILNYCPESGVHYTLVLRVDHRNFSGRADNAEGQLEG
jgi:hypothetical protein